MFYMIFIFKKTDFFFYILYKNTKIKIIRKKNLRERLLLLKVLKQYKFTDLIALITLVILLNTKSIHEKIL